MWMPLSSVRKKVAPLQDLTRRMRCLGKSHSSHSPLSVSALGSPEAAISAAANGNGGRWADIGVPQLPMRLLK